MEKFTGMDECKLTHNKVLGTPDLENTTIIFHGKGNILYCQNGVKIVNSTINFMQDHSVIFLCTNRGGYHLGVSINHNSVLFIGANNYFNAKLNIVISEYQNIIIGNDGLYSFDCWLRTADPHLIYDLDTHKRINESRSIVIGDHVWIGQHVYILKGSMIGSGSIVGAGSVVSGKSLESNAVYAGNPAKKVRNRIFFTGNCVHAYKNSDTKKFMKNETDEYIYRFHEDETMSVQDMDIILKKLEDKTEKKIEWIQKNLENNHHKNRFYMLPEQKTGKRKFPFSIFQRK